MKALRKLAAEDTELHLVDVPDPGTPQAGWATLDVTYAGICGTDVHIAHNQFPSWPPVTIGHEFTGVVRVVGAGGDESLMGQRVVSEPHSLACTTCHLCRRGHGELCAAKRSPGWGIDGGMAEAVTVPVHLLHRIPASVSDLTAALTEPTAIVVSGYERMPVIPGSTVIVQGPGPIGLLAALVAELSGAGRVVLVGRSSSAGRLALAEKLGVETWNSSETNVVDRARELTSGRGVDLVVDCSGSAAAIADAIAMTRRRGRMLVLGMSGTPEIAVPWNLAMNRALDVTFSMSSSWSSWDAALALMAKGALDSAPLATVFALESWRDAFVGLADRSIAKAILDPRPRPTAISQHR